MRPLIELSSVSFDYVDGIQSFRALKNITLNINKGEYVAILGASGSGKSTMLNILGLLAMPADGQYRLGDIDVTHLPEDDLAIKRRQFIGFVFQQFHLLPRLTALENILLPTVYLEKIRSSERSQYRQRALELMRELGVETKADSLPAEMSGGQKQRVAICRALLLDPQIILADEPTGALDAHTTQDVLAILDNLHARGKTVIVITHDSEVAARAKRRIVIKDGIISSDSGAEDSAMPTAESLIFARTPKFYDAYLTKFTDLTLQVRYAWRTLAAHKLRSLLTGLGLLIGIISIMFVAGLGVFSEKAFRTLFLNPATRKVYIVPDSRRSARRAGAYWPGLDETRDFPTFAKRFAPYGRVRPIIFSESCSLITASKSTRIRFQGMYDTHEYIELDTPLEKGRFPSAMEIENATPVVVLGSDAVSDLFAPDYPGRTKPEFPVGEKVAATNCQISQTFTIIGVLKPQDFMFLRTDANDLGYAPVPALLTAGMTRIFADGFSAIPNDGVSPRWLADSLANYLSSRASQKVEFRGIVAAEMLDKLQSMMRGLQGLTAFIGLLCIVVGGIGIMNIMLVSVRERIREIGISKSLGANPSQIRRQFLTESITLCLLSGVGGVMFGFVLNNAIAFAASKAFPKFGGFTFITAGTGIITGLLVSCFCGVGFGLYPALRAGRTDPVECLREE